MQTWTTDITDKKETFSAEALALLFHENALFVDIETTGLSPKYHFCYLIGCCGRQNDRLVLTQFFCDCPEDEADVLKTFEAFTQGYDRMITFNGMHFDLPFLEKRCRHHHLFASFANLEHTDIYRECQRLKKPLALISCRQKAIEEFLGIHREDSFDGGSLIPVYEEYVKKQDPRRLDLLKLHNFEDVLGMVRLIPILSYRKIPDQIRVTDLEDCGSELLIRGRLSVLLPAPIRLRLEGIYCILERETFRFSIPLTPGPLRYYLKDYRKYDYLPQEERVVPKTLAKYVDSSRKTPATPQTCFLSRDGRFFPLLGEFQTEESAYLFRKSYEDRRQYLLLDDTAKSTSFLEHYIRAFLLRFFPQEPSDPS